MLALGLKEDFELLFTDEPVSPLMARAHEFSSERVITAADAMRLAYSCQPWEIGPRRYDSAVRLGDDVETNPEIDASLMFIVVASSE